MELFCRITDQNGSILQNGWASVLTIIFQKCRWRRGEQDISLLPSSSRDQEMQAVEPERIEEEENVATITVRTRTNILTETSEDTYPLENRL